MYDFEDKKRFEEAVKAGQRNLRAVKLLSNWCSHSEFIRSGGRGMIEAETGLPIGHMGVQCKFVKQGSMLSWLLEDSIYSFYKEHCKGCNQRVPVGFPNIIEFVSPREKAAEERNLARREEEKLRKQKQLSRQQERATLRLTLTLEETFVLDLLDELDQEDIEKDDPRLEQLANLAPETFTRKIIEHLLPAVLHEKLPYSTPAAKALIKTSLSSTEKLSIAVYLVNNYQDSQSTIEVILLEAEKLSQNDFIKVLLHFVRMAVESPPRMRLGISERRNLNKKPIQSLFKKRQDDIFEIVDKYIKDAHTGKIQAAVEIILATDSDELLLRHIRSIFSKLMRRRTLLPEERSDSSVLYYLRETATKCLDLFPEETDKVIQAYLTDKDDIGRNEANRVYSSVLRHNYREKPEIGKTQKIAFRRLLWAAVEKPEEGMDDAGQFFRHSWDDFAELAVENFDDLIGAAATLSEKYEQLDKVRTVEIKENFLDHLEKSNKRNAIDSLQVALIEWAAIGAKSKGCEGIEDFLNLYRRLPEEQTQMRSNMIVHVSKLLTGIESLTLVLSDWYRALMDESTLVRAHAAQAWENVPYDLVQNFPDLFFEAYSVLLLDQYVIVHKYAVRSLRRRSFPDEKRLLVRSQLWNLICYYAQSDKQDDFVVECIDVFSSLCLSEEERKGNVGLLLSSILLSLKGSALYHAINRLRYHFNNVPGFVKVALKAIQDDYTRRISVDDCISVILRATHDELRNSKEDLENAFNALKPFKPQQFIEALAYVAALSKSGDNATAAICLKELLEEIPKDDRHIQWRLEAALVTEAACIEHAIGVCEPYIKLIEKWNGLMADLEKENAERAKHRDFPPSFFPEN
ncbi:hypothetical protein [Klebsiella grimontii]|uniref:hypothetical protein n=1 Tax=Klebsiella grimontii TaxID=2058152 RepID=UPI002242DC9A|nr:hypothetical protein [Klebsiella grimontii]